MLDYTVVVTSCGRFDLLAETLKSFQQHADIAPRKYVVIEDSCNPAVHAVTDRLSAPCTTIVNDQRLGQIQSIDRAYSEVETEWIFHCEDDWQFFRPGFIEESLLVLKRHPEISMVGLRPRSEFNKLVRNAPVEMEGSVPWVRFDTRLHPEYFGYSFNPGLRRMSDYRRFGPFARLGGEMHVSVAFMDAGLQMGSLEKAAVMHIGDGRHIDDPMQAKRPTNRYERLKRSIGKRVERFNRWRRKTTG